LRFLTRLDLASSSSEASKKEENTKERKASEKIEAYESIARLKSAENLKLTEMYSFLIDYCRGLLLLYALPLNHLNP